MHIYHLLRSMSGFKQYNRTMQDKNKQLFRKEWNAVYQSKDSKLIMVGNVQSFKVRRQGSHFVVLNKSISNKRESSLLGSKQKTVFIAFNSQKFNFCNVSNKEILFHINLDEQVLISKQQTHKITESFFDKQQGGEDDQIQAHTHPLLINTAPVCRFHSILSMYPDEELPQVVGSDILLLLLNVFSILPGIRLGYNSVGAAASVNHLHFHMVYPEDLVEGPRLPIETVERNIWLESSLSNPTEEINLYTVGVAISEINSNGTYAMVIQPANKDKQKLEISEVTNSLAFVFGIVANELIELNVPHNLLITDNGETIYVFIRDFCSQNNLYGWLQFSGVVVACDQKQFEVKQAQIVTKKKSLAIQGSTVDILKANIKKHLSKFS